MPERILLTGRPGIGKTTVVRRLADGLERDRIAGFYTEEIRAGGRRVGFTLTTLSGGSAVLAHAASTSGRRVGRYGVNMAEFEAVVLPELDRRCDLVLIDEIGKMECFSNPFVDAVRRVFESGASVVATVALKGGGLIPEVKARLDVDIIEVTESNRDRLPGQLAERVADRC